MTKIIPIRILEILITLMLYYLNVATFNNASCNEKYFTWSVFPSSFLLEPRIAGNLQLIIIIWSLQCVPKFRLFYVINVLIKWTDKLKVIQVPLLRWEDSYCLSSVWRSVFPFVKRGILSRMMTRGNMYTGRLACRNVSIFTVQVDESFVTVTKASSAWKFFNIFYVHVISYNIILCIILYLWLFIMFDTTIL